MSRAYLIDVAAREVRLVEYETTEDLRALLGGYLELACSLPNGDTLYVDDEGLRKAQSNFFLFELRTDQPLAGNGLLVGPERIDDDGNYLGAEHPRISLPRFSLMVRFVDRAWVESWGKGNASEPASRIGYVDHKGRVQVQTLTRWGQVVRDIPRPEEDRP
jgi:hypothetical protein